LTRRAAPVLAVLAALLACAPAASAGTYTAYACSTAGQSFGNRSWAPVRAGSVLVDNVCPSVIGVRIDAARTVAAGAVGGLTYTSPPGTAIVDFALTRRIDYDSPAVEGFAKPFTLYQLGSVVFEGAGHYNDTVRRRLRAQGRWYGYPANAARVPSATVTRSSFPALAAYRNDARTLIVRAGCYGGVNCRIGPGGQVLNVFSGARVVVEDPAPPSSVTVEALGLLAGGQRAGSDPVTVTASDNAGISRVELIDVTDPAAHRVIGAEQYDVGLTYEAGEDKTDRGATCSFRLVKPCPDLGRETLRASTLGVGRKSIVVRVFDAGGNAVSRGPYTVDVVTPADRGAPNGEGAKEPGRVILRFAGTRKARRTVGHDRKVRLRGRLLNADGAPIRGATLRLITRDLRAGAPSVDRRGIRTRTDGSFGVTVRARASRRLRVAWRARANDARFAAEARLTLRARAAASLRARPRSVAVGRVLTLRGRLEGLRRGGVPVVLQGKVRGARRFTTFADTTTSRRGRFRARYRFRTSAARGRTYVFRARIRRAPRFPYETGHTRTVSVRVR
jgi:hypothetical protein